MFILLIESAFIFNLEILVMLLVDCEIIPESRSTALDDVKVTTALLFDRL
jgi:hypothetical protein